MERASLLTALRTQVVFRAEAAEVSRLAEIQFRAGTLAPCTAAPPPAPANSGLRGPPRISPSNTPARSGRKARPSATRPTDAGSCVPRDPRTPLGQGPARRTNPRPSDHHHESSTGEGTETADRRPRKRPTNHHERSARSAGAERAMGSLPSWSEAELQMIRQQERSTSVSERPGGALSDPSWRVTSVAGTTAP